MKERYLPESLVLGYLAHNKAGQIDYWEQGQQNIMQADDGDARPGCSYDECVVLRT